MRRTSSAAIAWEQVTRHLRTFSVHVAVSSSNHPTHVPFGFVCLVDDSISTTPGVSERKSVALDVDLIMTDKSEATALIRMHVI
jgi:hypothetical protein